MPITPLHGLPQANAHFTALKGAGPVAHNLESQLHLRTLSTSSHLHPLKEHIGTIAKAFSSTYIKNAIRRGGLNAGEQKLMIRHIFEKDKELSQNVLKKTRLKELIHHYGVDQQGAAPASGTGPGTHPNRGVVAARRARMRAIDEEAQSPGSASMADVLRQNQAAQAASHQAITSAADIGGQGRGGFVKQNSAPATGSINQIMNRPKTGLSGGIRPGSRPGGLPPRLAV